MSNPSHFADPMFAGPATGQQQSHTFALQYADQASNLDGTVPGESAAPGRRLGVWTFDLRNGRFSGNQAWWSQLGRVPQPAFGYADVRAAILAEDQPDFETAIARCLHGERDVDIECGLADGAPATHRWVRFVATQVLENATIVGLAGLSVDVTDLKHTEAAIRGERRQLRQIAESATRLLLAARESVE